MKIIIGVIVLVVLALGSLLVMSSHTVVEMTPVTEVGVSTPVSVSAANPHGVRAVRAYLEQGSARYLVFEQKFPSARLVWGGAERPASFTFPVGKSKAPALQAGQAKLVVETASNDFLGLSDSASRDVKVVFEPPRVMPDDVEHYINQGGMGLATMSVSGEWSEAGVKAGKYTFRSFPQPGKGAAERFAMFAYPWDLGPDENIVVFARNTAGGESTAPLRFKLFPKKFRMRDFPVDDALMQKLVNSVDPSGQILPGKSVRERFLYINGEMRRKNNQTLADLRLKTTEKILWNGPFLHWGKEEANFADVRNYISHGEKIDQQVHLGFDLSDVTDGPVEAANDGIVVWASDMGIYGNCIVVDHGYALQSIYGHLKEIHVKVGDAVKKGQKMGIAGSTGLAGGIHVHFSMQIDGVQVNPREWWDEHWIRDRILSKLEPGTEVAAAETPAEAHPHKARKHKR